MSVDLQKEQASICGSVWTSPHVSRLMETLAYDIGPRSSGSEGMLQARAMVRDELSDIGVANVHSEPVELLGWFGGKSSVRLLSPFTRSYESLQHVHTRSGVVRGKLVDGGDASCESLQALGRDAVGSVLMVKGKAITQTGKQSLLSMRLRNIVAHNIAAVVVQNIHAGAGPSVERIGVDSDFPIPVAGVSYEDGNELISLARRTETKLEIDANGKTFPVQCANLIGDLGDAEETVVLSAHLDSHWHTPGALDNLTGVVTLLETARALAPYADRFRRRLRLILFTGEEYGWHGSRAYVKNNSDEIAKTAFAFNMDSLCGSTAEGVAVMWSEKMCALIKEIFSQTQCRVDVRNFFCMNSDYVAFMLAGIAAGRPADWRNELPVFSHTNMDTPDKIPLDGLRRNAMVYAQMLLGILMWPAPLPPKRLSREEVQVRIDKKGIGEELRFRGLGAYVV